MNTTLEPAARREIGVDVSKETLDVFDGSCFWQTPNSPAGVKDLIRRLRKEAKEHPLRVTCEATGRYGDLLAVECLKAGIPVSIANPRLVRDYAKSGGKLAKTDRLDARAIAAYSAHHNPPVLDAAWTERQKFVERYTRMTQLIDKAAHEKSTLDQFHEPKIQAEIRRSITTLERQIAAYEEELEAMIAACAELAAKSKALRQIKGVGKRTVQAALALMPELGKVNREQAAALAGLAPMNRDSGKIKGKRFIQGGRARFRKVLYMAALSASRFNPILLEFSGHLKEQGKPTKVRICAVARKLLVLMNSTLKNLS